MSDDDRKRLDEIVRCFVWCAKPWTAEDVAKQFKYETKRQPDVDQLARAVAKVDNKTASPSLFP